MPRVVHFEIPADDPERTASFYQDVFGWQFEKWRGPEDYWLINTGSDAEPGINGGMLRKRLPEAGTVNTIDVLSVDDYSARITEHGGKIVVPKLAVPGVGWLAYCEDPEGNVFGIMQADRSAG